jgi:hypothetical protein
MTDSYVQVQPDSSGKKLQTYLNTVGAESVHSEAMTLTNTDGVAVPTVNGKPRISAMPYIYDIAEGNVTGHKSFTKLGNVNTVVNAEQDVWSVGGKYVFPTSAMQMEVASANAQDTADGTGIQQVKIYYLDSTFAEKTETVTLNGGVVATTATDIYRVNAMRAARVGTDGKAAGLITLRHLSDTPIYRSISAGQTRGRSLIHTVPLGKTLYLIESNISSSATVAGHFSTFTLRANYDDQLDTKVTWMEPISEIALQDQAFRWSFDSPIKIPATCDVVMSVIADSSNANTMCHGSLRGWTET